MDQYEVLRTFSQILEDPVRHVIPAHRDENIILHM
jgi:hypothetical protein